MLGKKKHAKNMDEKCRGYSGAKNNNGMSRKQKKRISLVGTPVSGGVR